MVIAVTVVVVNTATYTVSHESPSITTPAAPPPSTTAMFSIFSVSPLIAATRQTITITGVGFGTNPKLVNDSVADDGSVNTLRDSTQPSILINDRTENWGAGYAQTATDYDHVGIYLASWSDTQIVIDGFSSLLGNATNPSRYVIRTGDQITVTVYGPNQIGIASYDTIVV